MVSTTISITHYRESNDVDDLSYHTIRHLIKAFLYFIIADCRQLIQKIKPCGKFFPGQEPGEPNPVVRPHPGIGNVFQKKPKWLHLFRGRRFALKPIAPKHVRFDYLAGLQKIKSEYCPFFQIFRPHSRFLK